MLTREQYRQLHKDKYLEHGAATRAQRQDTAIFMVEAAGRCTYYTNAGMARRAYEDHAGAAILYELTADLKTRRQIAGKGGQA